MRGSLWVCVFVCVRDLLLIRVFSGYRCGFLHSLQLASRCHSMENFRFICHFLKVEMCFWLLILTRLSMSCTDVQVKAWNQLFTVELRTKDINRQGWSLHWDPELLQGFRCLCTGSLGPGVGMSLPAAAAHFCESSISSDLIFLTPGHHGPLTSPSVRI